MFRGVVVAVVVVVATLTGAGVGTVSADGNEAPLAAAGLDQSVQQGSMVYLDAGGSVDPDGNITTYEWEITAPNGTTLSPACPSCVQTRFQAGQTGTYNVTVTVTDDEGATRSDTLYVETQAVESPSVSITGPAVVQNGTTESFEASVTAGDKALERVVWSVNGSTVARHSVAGESAERTLDYTVSGTGQRVIRARAVDRAGNSGSGTHVFESNGNSTNGSSPATNSSGDREWGSRYSPLDRMGNENGAYHLRLTDGKVTAGENNEIVITEEQVHSLTNYNGVKMGESWINTGSKDALIITNPEIKEDLDKDAGKPGEGFISDELKYLNKNGSQHYEYRPKWQKTSPGVNWNKQRKRFLYSTSSENRVDKPGWEYQGMSPEPTPNTYLASNKRSAVDERIGYQPKTSTEWKSSPSGGEVVDTKQKLTHFTWEETRTRWERVQVGTEIVGYDKEYGYTTETQYKTRMVCVEYTSLMGRSICSDYRQETFMTTERVREVVDKEPIRDPVYEWKEVETTVTKSGSSPPWDASNVESHYDTSYKIQKTEHIPLWQKYVRKYNYDVYEYKWVT
jgi:hypothetical protein